MDHRNPIEVIDQTVENLVYLVEWWVEDIEVTAAMRCDLLLKDDAKSVSALRAARALLPRLRIVRSNYESSPSLPDAVGVPRDRTLAEYCERGRTQLRHLLKPPPP